MEAKQAVDHGKQGHAEVLVIHAEKSMHFLLSRICNEVKF